MIQSREYNSYASGPNTTQKDYRMIEKAHGESNNSSNSSFDHRDTQRGFYDKPSMSSYQNRLDRRGNNNNIFDSRSNESNTYTGTSEKIQVSSTSQYNKYREGVEVQNVKRSNKDHVRGAHSHVSRDSNQFREIDYEQSGARSHQTDDSFERQRIGRSNHQRQQYSIDKQEQGNVSNLNETPSNRNINYYPSNNRPFESLDTRTLNYSDYVKKFDKNARQQLVTQQESRAFDSSKKSAKPNTIDSQNAREQPINKTSRYDDDETQRSATTRLQVSGRYERPSHHNERNENNQVDRVQFEQKISQNKNIRAKNPYNNRWIQNESTNQRDDNRQKINPQKEHEYHLRVEPTHNSRQLFETPTRQIMKKSIEKPRFRAPQIIHASPASKQTSHSKTAIEKCNHYAQYH